MNTKLAVKESALFLDRVTPDWYRHIRLNVLDLSNPDVCIVGQVYGLNYMHWLRTLREADAWEYAKMRTAHYAAARGFALDPCVDTDWSDEAWKKLTNLWINEIVMRLKIHSSSILPSGQTKSGNDGHVVTGITRRISVAIIDSLLTRVMRR